MHTFVTRGTWVVDVVAFATEDLDTGLSHDIWLPHRQYTVPRAHNPRTAAKCDIFVLLFLTKSKTMNRGKATPESLTCTCSNTYDKQGNTLQNPAKNFPQPPPHSGKSASVPSQMDGLTIKSSSAPPNGLNVQQSNPERYRHELLHLKGIHKFGMAITEKRWQIGLDNFDGNPCLHFIFEKETIGKVQ